MELPDDILPLLECEVCHGYLSSQPVLLSEDGKSVCGRCTCNKTTRNFAYEAVAQLMKFPCRYRNVGCVELMDWNKSGDHEAICDFGKIYSPAVPVDRASQIIENCVLCRKNMSIQPRYQCNNNHDICVRCSKKYQKCPLCQSKFNEEPYYMCRYWKNGCRFKSSKDSVCRHESDCDTKSFNCPFLDKDCEWEGPRIHLVEHLQESHSTQILTGHELKRVTTLRDDSWVMVAHEEVFKCSVWIGETEVEWFAKYVGPQHFSYEYTCEVALLHNTKKTSLKMTNHCLGWNNVYLEKGISITWDDIPNYVVDGKLVFKFKILKNNTSNDIYTQL